MCVRRWPQAGQSLIAMHCKNSTSKVIALRRIFSVCIVAVGMSFGLSNVAAQRGLNPVALVPSTAVAVAKINWRIVRQDERFRAMLNADQLDRALGQLKIGRDEVSEIAIFSGINGTPTGVLGGIFSGSFDSAAVTTALRSQGSTEHRYGGHIIYAQLDQSYASIMRSGMLVVGTRKAVEGVIDVISSPRSGLSLKPPFNSLLRRFVAGKQPISFAMALPLEYQMVAEVGVKVISALFSFSGLGPLGFVIDKIGLPNAIGFAVSHTGNTFPTTLIAKMKDESAAALISGTLTLAQSINLDMFSNRIPQSDRDMLKNISVKRTGSLLSISLVLRESDLPRTRR